uniref:Uncharacterized protein n=1 Tax=Cynoglossus semilaevis TaxID=244447 RepID=A0A3P8WIR5_CYNSE
MYNGFLSILYSVGSKPLQIWDAKHHLYHVSGRTPHDPGHQTAVHDNDHQKPQEVFLLRSASARR